MEELNAWELQKHFCGDVFRQFIPLASFHVR